MRQEMKPLTILNKRLFRLYKSRNAVAVTAIAMTTLLFTTLFVLSQSQSRNLIEMTYRQTGYDAQVSFKKITTEQIEKISAHPDVAETGESLLAGLGQGEALAGRQVEIRYADESYAVHSFAEPETGRMPQTAQEIALDTITLDKLGIPHELGESVTLEWIADFTEKDCRRSEFTLCGFWEGNESVYASMAWVSREFAERAAQEAEGIGEEEIRKGESEVFAENTVQENKKEVSSRIAGIHMAQVSLYHDKHIEQTMDSILEDTGLLGLEYSINLAYDPDMNRMKTQESLPMYLGMILVFVAGYLIIYNIFQISVTADIQFYGQLKTLGTTKKQLKKIIYGQAGRLCLIGVPAGMLAGYLLGVLLVPVLAGNPDAPVSASPVIFAGSALFACITVLISCRRPAAMAGKVSPIEALRYADVQSAASSSKSSRKRSGSASLPALAWFNLGRNKKRTVTVICSLTLGLTLMSIFYAKNAAFDIEKYLGSLTLSDFQIDDATSEDYRNGYNPRGDTLSQELLDNVSSLEGLEDAGCLYSHETAFPLDEQTLANLRAFYTDELLADWSSYDSAGPAALQEALEKKEASSIIFGADDIVLAAYTNQEHLQAGDYDAAAFLSGNYVLALAPGVSDKESVLPTASVGETVQIEGKSYTVMAVLDKFNAVTQGAREGGQKDDFCLEFIMPVSEFRENWPDNTPRKLFFNVAEPSVDKAQEMLDDYSRRTGISLSVTSRASMSKQYAKETRSSAVMGNVISVVIALVGVLNFVNSMVTSIVSRKKEFAMMQSVGMTKKQLCRLLLHEGMYYAFCTLLITYMFSALAVGVGVRAMVEGGFTTFRFTLMPLIVCTPVLLFFALIIPYLCFRNIEKQSLTERLRAV